MEKERKKLLGGNDSYIWNSENEQKESSTDGKTLDELYQEQQQQDDPYAGMTLEEAYAAQQREEKNKNGSGLLGLFDNDGKNNGGLGGGMLYLGSRLLTGGVRGVEGVVDFVSSGIASLAGNDDKAKSIMQNDWIDYEAADNAFEPGTGWKFAGDVAGALGGIVPEVLLGVGLAAVGLSGAAIAVPSIAWSGISAAGQSGAEAVDKTGELGAKEWSGAIGQGIVSAGIEAISGGVGDLVGDVFGKTAGEMGGEIAESLGGKLSKESLESLANKGSSEIGSEFWENIIGSRTAREIFGEGASEALEEGFEALLEPLIKRQTYDPDAQISARDVLYQSLVGGVTGVASSAGKNITTNSLDAIRGSKLYNKANGLTNLLKNAESIGIYESNAKTGSTVFEAVSTLYSKVASSLKKDKMTVTDYENIGLLDRAVASYVLEADSIKAATGIVQNAERTAYALNNYYSRIGSGQSITAEQLTKGIETDSNGKVLASSIKRALQSNGILSEVLVNNMLGRYAFDAQQYADSIYGDVKISNIVTHENINRFLANADKTTLAAVSEALGISDWANLTPNELAAAIKEFRDSGRADAYREGTNAARQARAAAGTEALPLPSAEGRAKALESLDEGVTRYSTDGVNVAIIRNGDKYRLYDYESGHITKALSASEMDALLSNIEERLTEFKQESEMQILEREIDEFAQDKIPEYKKLTEPEREAVRETIRRARVNGLSLEEQILLGRIAAKSGIKLLVTNNLEYDAWYDGKNTVYIKADGSKVDIYSGLLGHEVFHKMFKSSKVKRLFMEAWNNTPEAKRMEVRERYLADLKKNENLSEAERVSISNEEVAAAYAQELFNSPDVWDFILDGEATLSDRVISFFTGAPKRYYFAKEMDVAAKRWLNHYKKLFNEVAALNKGTAALQNAGFDVTGAKPMVIGRTTDGSYDAENADFDGLRTANEPNVQVREGRASLKDIVGESGTEYGIGVYLDSTLLSGLNEDERIQMVKEYVKELGGRSFTAYDKNHKNVDVHIAEANRKFKNKSGKSTPVNKDLTSYLRKTVKQESIALIDELIVTSTLQNKTKSQYSHDWLDNYGKNDWEYWTTYIQDKENAIWEATLNIVTTANGEKILYDIVPIKKVEQSVTSDTSTTTHSIYNSAQNVKTYSKNFSKTGDLGGRSALDLGEGITVIGRAPGTAGVRGNVMVVGRADTKAGENGDSGGRAALKPKGKSDAATVKLKATYETDTVFNKSTVENALAKSDFAVNLPKGVKKQIIDEMFVALNESMDDTDRLNLKVKYTVKIRDEITGNKSSEYYGVRGEKLVTLREEIDSVLDKLIKSGKESKRARLAEEARNGVKAEEAKTRSILSRIYASLKRIDDNKRRRFAAASDYKGKELGGAIDALTRLDWRGTLNHTIARKQLKVLSDWYVATNPMLKKQTDSPFEFDYFDPGIRERLDILTKSENGPLSVGELQMLSDVLEYFSKTVAEYDRVYLNNKWQSGEELAYKFADTINSQAENKLPTLIRAMRGKIAALRDFGDPLSVIKNADMYEDGIFTTYYNEWQNGILNADYDAMMLKQEYTEFVEKHKGYLEKKAAKAKVDLHGVAVTRLELAEYFMTLKRKDAWESIAKGGIIVKNDKGADVNIKPIPDITVGRGYEAALESAIASEREYVKRLLSKTDLQYVEILERAYLAAKNLKAEGDMRRLGFVSVIDEYYYPIKRAYTEHLTQFWSEVVANDKYANASFNKHVAESTKSPVKIESADATFHKYVKGVTGYVHLSPVMDSFNKLYKLKLPNAKAKTASDFETLIKSGNTFSLQSLIAQSPNTWRDNSGVVGFNFLQNIMLDTMGQTKQRGDWLTGFLSSGGVGYALGANPKVWVTQFSSLWASSAILHKRALLRGAFIWRGGVDEYSIVAALRNNENVAVRAQNVMGGIRKVSELTTKMIGVMDRFVVQRAFAACQAEVAMDHGPKIGTEENLMEAGKLLNQVILETQQNTIASRRPEGARRGNTLLKSMMMFKSDAITTFGRIIDGYGECNYLKARLRDKNLDTESRTELKRRLSTARRKLRKAVNASVMSSVYMLIVAEAWRALRGQLDPQEEDDERFRRLGTEFLLNMLGGMPAVSEVLNAVLSEFDVDVSSMEFSVLTNLLTTLKDLYELSGKIFDGTMTERDINRAVEKSLYAIGQVLGLPVRNVKNLIYMIVRNLDSTLAYQWDSALYSQNYAENLFGAIESDDPVLASYILELAFGEKVGSGLSVQAMNELIRLMELGESMLPSALSNKVTVDGVERELNGLEYRAAKNFYGKMIEAINALVNSDVFATYNDEQKASAVRSLYSIFKDLAYDQAIGTDLSGGGVLLYNALGIEKLSQALTLGVIDSDKDEDGETIEGSKRSKTLEAIQGIASSVGEALFIFAACGYVIKNGDADGYSAFEGREAVYEYISGLDVSKSEKLELYEEGGFDVKNGKPIIEPPSSSDLSYVINAGKDEATVKKIFDLFAESRIGTSLGDATVSEIARLIRLDNSLTSKLVPSGVGDSVTINGKTYEITEKIAADITKEYGGVSKSLESFVNSSLFESYDDAQKASAIGKILDMWKELAFDKTVGTGYNEEMLLLASVVDVGVLSAWSTLGVLTADKDENGKSISGSKRDKVWKAIADMDISYEQKLLLFAAAGYAIKEPTEEIILYKYIAGLDKLNLEQRNSLLLSCGFEFENGGVVLPDISDDDKDKTNNKSESDKSTSGSKNNSKTTKAASSSRRSSASLFGGGLLTKKNGTLSSTFSNRIIKIGKWMSK